METSLTHKIASGIRNLFERTHYVEQNPSVVLKMLEILKGIQISLDTFESTGIYQAVQRLRKESTNDAVKKRCLSLLFKWISFIPKSRLPSIRNASGEPTQAHGRNIEAISAVNRSCMHHNIVGRCATCSSLKRRKLTHPRTTIPDPSLSAQVQPRHVALKRVETRSVQTQTYITGDIISFAPSSDFSYRSDVQVISMIK